MIGRIFIAASLAATSLSAPATAAAQESVSLDGDVKVVRLVETDGNAIEQLEEPTSVLPGDRLVFTTSYRNNSAEEVTDFVITNPLPGAVQLAEDGTFNVSVDGGANFAPLAELTVADGEAGERAATVSDVTHVRWTLARLAAGEDGQVTYFAVVR